MKNTLLLLLLICPFTVLAQGDVKYITLVREKTPFRLNHFHITAVRDIRDDTSNVGIIHTGLSGKKEVALKMQPNVAASLLQFICTNYVQDTSTTPIEIQVVKLKADHVRMGLKSRNDLDFTIAFFTKGEKITDYKGDGYTEGITDPAKMVEELLRNNLHYGLQRFNEWWTLNKDQYNASLGNPLSVSVEAAMATAATDEDLIVFAHNRPLLLTDFTGQADDLSLASAVTYSGIQLKTTSQTNNGHAKVQVQIIPYFYKSRSWCRKAHRTAKTLQHEQQHFNLTALKACELLEAIRRFAFTANFDTELNQLQKQNEKSWDQLQRQYDVQTNHGRASAEQQKWNKWIQEELAKHACFN